MPNKSRRLLVTGGAGFIGSSFIRYGLDQISSCECIVNLDKLTYAANLDNLASVENEPRYRFIKGDICNQNLVERICIDHQIDTIVHFAAETHVDRSIAQPNAFYETNVGGTIALLEVVRRHPYIHFHHISTDEVYGSLPEKGAFSETSPYHPNSPYSASKAASDHFVRAYAHTYGISTTISHCTNNYGPGQHVEKLIPHMIAGCLFKRALPVYGNGKQVRDWIYVDDHSEAVWAILEKKEPGETFDIGGECEKHNIDLIHILIEQFAFLKGEDPEELKGLISFVADRPGHDVRYAVDCRKIKSHTGWRPLHDLSTGIHKTIAWYLEHPERLKP